MNDQMRQNRASAADLAAVARVLGYPHPEQGSGTAWAPPYEQGWVTATVKRRTTVSPSSGKPLDAPPYVVEERIDTVNGGMYVFCPCVGWKFAKGRGKDCRHAAIAKERWGITL
jgi:hypothetical protein